MQRRKNGDWELKSREFSLVWFTLGNFKKIDRTAKVWQPKARIESICDASVFWMDTWYLIGVNLMKIDKIVKEQQPRIQLRLYAFWIIKKKRSESGD